MSNRIGRTQVGGYEWNLDNRGRYAIYQAVGISGVIVGWAVTRDGESVIDRGDRPKTLTEAMDAAYADAKARALKEPS